MYEVLTVCSGNICRSPLAEVVLKARLGSSARVHSAGTVGLDSAPMTDEAQKIAIELGARAEDAAAHRSRYLFEQDLVTPDLVLAMSREHRRRIVELRPARLRSAFTAREFARLAADASDDDLLRAADAAGADPAARVRAAVGAVAAMRGASAPPADPADDDVIDPYRRSWATYQLSASQLAPALDQVVRVLTTATA